MHAHLTFADLVDRWVYTKWGLKKLRKRDDAFPKPVVTKPYNRGNLWREEDVIAYENLHPELLSEQLKRRKVSGYARAIRKG